MSNTLTTKEIHPLSFNNFRKIEILNIKTKTNNDNTIGTEVNLFARRQPANNEKNHKYLMFIERIKRKIHPIPSTIKILWNKKGP